LKALALLALLAACAPESTATVVEVPPAQVQPSPQPEPAPQVLVQRPVGAQPLHGGEVWRGTYVCAQGETDLALHVESVSDGAVEAVFEFEHAPSGASGAYRMNGTVSPDGAVELAPGAWIRRPPNYVGVGMRGRVRGDSFTGRIENSTCGGFRLRR